MLVSRETILSVKILYVLIVYNDVKFCISDLKV